MEFRKQAADRFGHERLRKRKCAEQSDEEQPRARVGSSPSTVARSTEPPADRTAPALNVWESAGGFGKTWTQYDLPTEHNRIVADAERRFCADFENATLALGWAESSAYTTLVATGPWLI